MDVKGLANLILDWADDCRISVSPMKLQKLVYYCHADFLVIVGKPLIDQDFEAWEFGPVVPSLFHEFKEFSLKPITSRASRFNPETCEREIADVPDLGRYESVVRSSFDVYARYAATTLSDMSHSEQGPWAETLRRFEKGSARGRSIENRIIERHHRSPAAQSVH